MKVVNKLPHHQRKFTLKHDAGEAKCRMFLKKDGCTFLLCNGLSWNAANGLAMYIEKFCNDHDVKLNGNFIFTR